MSFSKEPLNKETDNSIKSTDFRFLIHSPQLMGIQRLTGIILPPIDPHYSLSSVMIDRSNGNLQFHKTKKVPIDNESLLDIIKGTKGELLICHLTSKNDIGNYAFIDESGKVTKQLTNQRSNGRFFLKQFFEDAVLNSFQGTGSFEVYPLPHSKDLENGQITHYYSRANDIFRALSGKSLESIGLGNKRRRDSYEDENGNALPVYRYDLTCNLLLIQPELKASLSSPTR